MSLHLGDLRSKHHLCRAKGALRLHGIVGSTPNGTLALPRPG